MLNPFTELTMVFFSHCGGVELDFSVDEVAETRLPCGMIRNRLLNLVFKCHFFSCR